MTGLLVMAELLVAGDLPQASRRYAEVISRSGQALLAIINDILDFSKMEAGKLDIEQVPVDPRDVANTVIGLFHARAREKGLDLAARFASDLPRHFLIDPVRLQQVIGNLVNNALKFTESGSVLVDIHAGPDGTITFDVVDTGIGIEEAKLPSVFEAFSQADGTTTRRFGGTGLGLTISTRLAEAMGGGLTVRSRLGVGSTFSCTIPMRTPVPAPARKRLGDIVVHVAVDGWATRQAAVASLENVGCVVRQGPLAEMDVGPTRLLIVEASSGPGRPRRGDAQVIALAEPGLDVQGLGEHVDAVLTKPLIEDELLAILDRMDRGEALHTVAAHARTVAAQAVYDARVLVADDTAVNREVMQEALKRFGIRPDFAEDGREALQAAVTRPYDLVFMDGSMPELDGFEACRRLRALEADGPRRTTVIALTAHVVGPSADAWVGAGMDAVLYKPFTIADLTRCLATWLPDHVDPEGATGATDDPPQRSVKGASGEPLIDRSVLHDMAALGDDTGRQFIWRVFKLYRDHAPACIAQAQAAVTSNRGDDLASAAHALKSMSFNIGAKQIAAIAGALEGSAREGTSGEADLARLQACFALTLAEVDVVLDSVSDATDAAAA